MNQKTKITLLKNIEYYNWRRQLLTNIRYQHHSEKNKIEQ